MRPSGRKCVIYRAPCARRLRTLEELDKYLSLVDSHLVIDFFCYDPWLHVHTEFVPVKVSKRQLINVDDVDLIVAFLTLVTVFNVFCTNIYFFSDGYHMFYIRALE